MSQTPTRATPDRRRKNNGLVAVTAPATGDALATPALTTLLDRMATPVWIFDIDRRCMVWGNPAGCAIWRAENVEALRARDFASDMSVTVATKLRQYKEEFERGDASFSEVWTHYPLGKPATMRITYRGIRLADGRMAMLCEGGGDFKETPDKLRSAEALVHTSVQITLSSESGELLYRNPAATSSDPGLGPDMVERFVDQTAYAELREQLRQNGQATVVAEMVTSRGTRWHEITARYCLDPATGSPACLSSEVDVTELKTTEAQARFAACHDPLTNLPNRVAVQTVFEQKLRSILSAGRSAALLFIDVDRFKTINDSLGHGRGDQLLVEIAQRLSTVQEPNDEIARLGGDEYLLLLDLSEGRRQLAMALDRVLMAIQAPLQLGEHLLRLTASVGVSVAPSDGTDIPVLMKNADAAMYEAKKAGRNRAVVYQPEFGLNALVRMKLEIDLQRDFDERVLQLYYQPRVSIATGRIVGAEVLLRWPHATSGFIPPDVFITIAEENGLIVPIGAWMMRKAARQQARWRQMGFPVSISINLSPRQFGDGDLVGNARQALDETGADASAFELEITERLLLGNEPRVSQTLDALKQMGFAIAIDDFGTGYSNLAQLQRHPIDCLKIDRSFVAALSENSAILDLIIRMCNLLKVKIVAEGVETPSQLEWLAARQVEEYQGFYYSPAVPAAQFERMLEQGMARTDPMGRTDAMTRTAQLVA